MNVNVRIKLPSNNQLQKEIQQAVKLMEKYSLLEMKIDTKSFTKSLSSMSNELSKLKTQLSKFNIRDNIVDDSKIIQSKKQVNDLADTIGKLNEKSQIKVKNNDRDAELKQAQAINKVLDEQYSKQQNLNVLQENLRYKLNISKENSFIDDGVITKLQSQLDSINTNTSEKEISELKTAINNLSSTDGSIVRVQNSIVKLEQRISNIKDNKIDIVDKNDITELKQAENELNNLKNILNQLQGGEVIDGKKISSSINTATNSVRTLENSFKGANTVAGGLSNTVKNMFSYIAGGSLGYLAVSNIKESVSTVIELNTALTGLKKVTDETNATYDKFLSNMHNVSLELGTQSNKMVDAVTNWAKTGESLVRASKLAENTILLTKVGDVESVDTAQNYMLPALKAFNIEAENSINLINEYNNISNNMATTTNDIGSAMSKSASSMAVAGNTLEQTIAMIATAESITKLGGDSIGQAMKSLSMRLATFKDDETGEIIPKMAESIKSLTNVDITDLNGQLKNTYDIYMEIGQVYKDLDRNSQLQINEILGGKLRGNVVSAILSNVDELQRAYDLANNSAGSAMAEFEKYQDSIQYSVDRLKEQINGLYTTFVDSDFLKGITEGAVSSISTIQKVLDTFGAFPTVVSTVVASLVIFNGKFRETTQMMLSFNPTLSKVFSSLNGLSTSLKSNANTYSAQISKLKELTIEYQKTGVSTSTFGGDLARLQGKLVITQAGLVAVKVASVALQSIISMGLTLGVSMLVSGFVKLADSLVLTRSELKELNNEFSSTASQSNATKLNDLISKYKELELKLTTLKTNTEEYKNKESELAKIQEQIIQLYPQASELIDGNTEAKRLNLEKTKKLAEEELNILKAKAIKTLDNNEVTNTDDIKKAIQDYEVYSKVIEKVVDLNGKGSANIDVGDWNSSGKLFVAGRDAEYYIEKVEETKTKLEALLGATKLLEDENEDLEGSTYLLEKALGVLNNKLDDTTNSSADEILDSLSDSADNANTSISNLTDEVSSLNDELGNLKSINELVKEAIDEFSQYGMLTEDTFDKILSNGTPEMVAALQDANTFLDTYNKLLIEGEALEENHRQAIIDKNNEILNGSKIVTDAVNNNATNYDTDSQNYSNSVNNKIKDSIMFANDTINSVADTTTQNGNNYDTDSQNYANLVNNKIQNSIMFANDTIDSVADATTQNAENYDTDQKNWRGIVKGKLGNGDDFVNGVTSGIANMVNQNSSNYRTDAQNFTNAVNSKIDSLRSLNISMGNIAKKSDILNASSDNFLWNQLNTFGALTNAVNTYTSSLGSAYKVSHGLTDGVGKFESGSGSSSSGSGSGSSSKEISDAEFKIDKYYKLNDVLADYNNLLDANRRAQENASPEELNDFIVEEISLMEKKKSVLEDLKKGYEDESSTIKKTLQQNGFLFDSYGNLINAEERLGEITDKINSSSGDDKEKQKENLKDLEDLIERFTYLSNTEIPKATAEIDNLNNSIQGIALDKLNDMRERIVDALRTSIQNDKENEIKILDDRIKALQDELKGMDNDYEDKVARRAKLEEQLKLWESDNSVYGRKQAAEIRKELEDLNKEIRKNEIELEIENIEKEKENISEIYDQKLEEKKLYNEADRLLTEGHMDEIKALLEGNSEDFKSLGGLLGESFKESFVSEIELALESLKLLKGEESSLTDADNSPTVPDPTTTVPPSNGGSSKPPEKSNSGKDTGEKPVVKGSKVKVSNLSDAIYVDSYTRSSSGTWKGAGVGANETLYVVNDNNGRVALSRTNNIYGALGWINKKSVKAFNIGGHTGNSEGMAWLDKQERVLTARQTKSFEDLVDMLPNLVSNPILKVLGFANSTKPILKGNTTDGTNITINNNFDIENNTPFSLERQDENITKIMKRELRKFGKIK